LASIKKLQDKQSIWNAYNFRQITEYLLVPLQTYVFATAQYGIIGEMYAWMSLLFGHPDLWNGNGFFRFSQIEEYHKKSYSTALFPSFPLHYFSC
jgi:hypothetical protein